nr:zinc finger protein 91-like [Pseudochaenichthys georgianus]
METPKHNTGLSSKDSVCKSTSQARQNVSNMSSKSNATNKLFFKCPHCTQRFRYRSILMRHLVSHTGVQPYSCMHCGHCYRSKSMCLKHEAFCDGVDEEDKSKIKDAAATQLSKTLTPREAAQHPKAEGEAEFKCKFCTKSFMKSRSLRRHILTHNEVKPYRCKACDSCFSRHDHLKVHEIRCRGKKTRLEICIPKISLDYVGKGWQNNCETERNAKLETFECKVCSRSFPSQSKLSRHVTMFHAPKPFKCTRCGSSFTQEGSLKKHRKTKKCRRPYNEPSETNPQTEDVTNPLKGVRNRIIQRIQPYFSKNYRYACSYCPPCF